MKDYAVYAHTFPNGKKYIGITSDAEKRWRDGKGYETQKKVWNAIKHYGWDSITHEILIDGLSKGQAEKMEMILIQAYDSIENGYNNSVGGDKINASYLDEHVLYMIRESKRYDKKYGIKQEDCDIITEAEKAKYNKDMANVFNYFDQLIEQKYTEYKTYNGSNHFYDFGHIRTDCYWWTMAMLMSGEQLNGRTPYWNEFIKTLYGS